MKKIRCILVFKTVGILVIGAIIGYITAFTQMNMAVKAYVQENRSNYYNEQMKRIEQEIQDKAQE